MGKKFFSKVDRVEIGILTNKDYAILDIRCDVGIGIDLSGLTGLIRKSLKKGTRKIALRFTEKSYLYTPTLATLVNYYKMIDVCGGKLCLIKPNKDILELLEVMGLADKIEIISEDSLKKIGAAVSPPLDL